MTGRLPSTSAIKRAVRTAISTPAACSDGSLRKTGTNAPKQDKVSRVNLLCEFLRLSRHEPPIAQLGSRIARLGNFIKHLHVPRNFPFQFEFECSPGTRRVSDLDHCITSV